jgi:hypothetical protein
MYTTALWDKKKQEQVFVDDKPLKKENSLLMIQYIHVND